MALKIIKFALLPLLVDQYINSEHEIMQKQLCLFSLLIITTFAWSVVCAEMPALSRDALNSAPLIVSGIIKSVTESQSTPYDCLLRHRVVITVKALNGRSSRSVSGFYDEWTCTTWKNGQPPKPQPPGNYGIWGIKAIKVGELVKIYAEANGNIFVPNGIEINNAKP